jgi:hypothetical protein
MPNEERCPEASAEGCLRHGNALLCTSNLGRWTGVGEYVIRRYVSHKSEDLPYLGSVSRDKPVHGLLMGQLTDWRQDAESITTQQHDVPMTHQWGSGVGFP